MKSLELLSKINYQKTHGDCVAVTNITMDTRTVTPGSCFVCIRGFVTDGHSFAGEAADKGATLIVFENREAYIGFYVSHQARIARGEMSIVLVENSRNALAEISDAFYDHPSGKLDLIGITGTKGKTTTSLMIKNVFDVAGEKTGLIGTMYNMVGDKVFETERTTPEANTLQELLGEMVSERVSRCVMECSSQGLKLNRVGGCDYKIGVFTNLTPDHIGATEHPNMEDYAASKAILFSKCQVGIFNCDSDWYEKISSVASCKRYTYSIEKDGDFKAINIVYGKDCTEYDVTGQCEQTHIKVKIPGKFSVYNSLAAFATCYLSGIPVETIVKGLSEVVVKGKAEIVPTGRDFTVMIDYAHNPDSFINIITTAKAFAKRVVFVFGAGGDRNRPRELMGETAATYADFTIITSDNPRSEDPAKIVADIAIGAKKTGKPFECIVDRREAICYAIKNAKPGDVIILAGKGHETTQILKDKTIHFDEREVVKEALENY